jgi:hypothetical protein
MDPKRCGLDSYGSGQESLCSNTVMKFKFPQTARSFLAERQLPSQEGHTSTKFDTLRKKSDDIATF